MRPCDRPRRGHRHWPGLDRLLLEAGPAQNRSPLGGLERHRSLSAAGRARGAGFRPHPGSSAGALCLALLAALGVISEFLVVEKKLLACSEHKISSAIDALENLILEFHGRLPRSREGCRVRPQLGMSAGPDPCLQTSVNNEGPGRKKSAARSFLNLRIANKEKLPRLTGVGDPMNQVNRDGCPGPMCLAVLALALLNRKGRGGSRHDLRI